MARTKAWFILPSCIPLLAACQLLTFAPTTNSTGQSQPEATLVSSPAVTASLSAGISFPSAPAATALPAGTGTPVDTGTPGSTGAKTPLTPEGLPTATSMPAVVLSMQTLEETSVENRYSIDARWPVLEWGDDPRVAAFNQTAETFALGEVRSFKEGVSDLPSDPVFQDLSSSLKIDFMPTNNTNGIFAVLFQISFYTAGAAHPGHYSHAINYDLRSGRVLTLENIFLPDSAYLDVLSTVCLQDLKRRKVLEWEEGALPSPENFQVWSITPQGILITFDEYQVASYAAGAQSVLVPYETLRPYLRPDGPLGSYFSQ